MVELRCLRIATSPQTQGKVHHIADVNDTSALNFPGPYAVTKVNANAPKFGSELSDGMCLLARETHRCVLYSLRMLVLFSRYKEMAYLNSGIGSTAERGENSHLRQELP